MLDSQQRKQAIQRIAQRLHFDENRTYTLFQKTEKREDCHSKQYR